MIPPDAQRFMAKRADATVVEEKGSHAIYVSKPEVVAALIEKAANVANPTLNRAIAACGPPTGTFARFRSLAACENPQESDVWDSSPVARW